jgi:hypothetical protein
MKKTLRLMAAILLAGSLIFWTVAGANRGWTKTQIPIKTMDPVTGLDGIQWQKKFVPGVDFLAVALLGAAVLAGLSLLVPLKSNQPQIKTEQ